MARFGRLGCGRCVCCMENELAPPVATGNKFRTVLAQTAMRKQRRKMPTADLALLRQFVAAHGGNIRSAAEEVGLAHTTIWRWLHGHRCPRALELDGLRARLTSLIDARSSRAPKKSSKLLPMATD